METPSNSTVPIRRSAVVPLLAFCAAAVALCWVLAGLLDVLLLGFAGLLFALFLHGAGAWLAQKLRVPASVGVAAICIVGAGLTALSVFLAVPAVAEQMDDLGRELPKATERVTEELERYEWSRPLLRRAEQADELLSNRKTMSRAGGILSTGLGALGAFIAFLFIGLFVAFEPAPYRRGVLRLFAKTKRPRIDQILTETAHDLRMWMAGKLFAMFVVGVLTWLGLLLLGIPLGLTLTLLAAALTFVPNFGPIIAAVPAVLLGLMDGPTKALYVALLYLSIQTVESYFLTPLVQKKTVSLPPALTLFAQLVMGVLAGGVGVVVATPLTAVALVLVKRLYVEDALGDDLDRPVLPDAEPASP